MKQRWWIPLLVLAGAVAVAVVRLSLSPREDLTASRQSRQVMGTLATIHAVGHVAHKDQLDIAVHQAFAAIDRVEALLSHHRDDSLIGTINHQAADHPVQLDPLTADVLRQARDYWRLSHGAFDPTCGPLIELWKHCAKEDRLPTDDELAAAKARVGFDKVELALDATPPTIRFTQPGMHIDLGGIGKGFAVDLATDELKRAGCTGGLVVIGGDIRAFGRPDDDEHWEIAVQNPFQQGTLMVLSLNDGAVSTSGNYHRFAIIQGRRYSHIVDPRTGQPAEATPSVTIVGPKSTGVDALATAVNVLGLNDGLALLHEVPDYETMMVVGSPDAYEMKQSTGFSRYIRH